MWLKSSVKCDRRFISPALTLYRATVKGTAQQNCQKNRKKQAIEKLLPRSNSINLPQNVLP